MADTENNGSPSLYERGKEGLSDFSHKVRESVPPGPLRDSYDRNVGRVKGAVGTVEEAVEGVAAIPDLVRAAATDPVGTAKAVGEGIKNLPGDFVAEKQKEFEEAKKSGKLKELEGKWEAEAALAIAGGGGTAKAGIKVLSKLRIVCKRILKKSKKLDAPEAAKDAAKTSGVKGGGPKPINERVKWVKEDATMSDEAKKYQAGAANARVGEAPALEYTSVQGKTKMVRLDGVEGDIGIDRKTSIVMSKKMQNQALRQSRAFEQNGMTGRWEVPTEAEAKRAKRLFDKAEVINIDVKVVPK